MKKMTCAIAVLFSIITFNAFAARTVYNNEGTAPSYDSGLSFGLAGFETKSFKNSVDANSSINERSDDEDPTDGFDNTQSF